MSALQFIARTPVLRQAYRSWLWVDTCRCPLYRDRRPTPSLIEEMWCGNDLQLALEAQPLTDARRRLLSHVEDFVAERWELLEFRGSRLDDRRARVATTTYLILDGYAHGIPIADLREVLDDARQQIRAEEIRVPSGTGSVPVPWQLMGDCLTELRFRVERDNQDAGAAAAAIFEHEELDPDGAS